MGWIPATDKFYSFEQPKPCVLSSLRRKTIRPTKKSGITRGLYSKTSTLQDLDSLHPVLVTDRWRIGRHMPLNVYGEPAPDWPEGRPVCQCHHADDAARIVDAVNAQAGQEPPMYPATKFLTLCTLEGRRVGAVTVGESRLPVVDVLGLIRSHGVGEAQLTWPQLADDDLAVLARLVGDLDAREEDDDG